MGLLFREITKIDECLPSYLIRISELNGFKHLGYLLRYSGLEWKNNRAPIHQILSGEFDLTPYFEKLDLGPHANPTENKFHTFRTTLDTHQLFVHSPKVCPRCLSEYGYAKAVWAYLPMICCIEHEIMLVDVDNETGKRLSWYRPYLNKFNLSQKNQIDEEIPATKSVIDFSRLVQSLIEDKPTSQNIPPVLLGLDFRETLTFLHFISHYRERLLGNHFKPVSEENIKLAQIYIDVWDMLKSWPDSFYEMLSQYIDSPMSKRGKSGLNKHFRDVSEKLNRQSDNNGIKRIKAEFERYIENYWPGFINTTVITRFNVNNDVRDIISKKEATSILDCRGDRIDKYVQQNRLSIRIFKGKAHYSKEEVTELVKLIDSNWTMKQLCKNLEITRYQAKQALEANIFPLIQKPDSLNRDWLIDAKKTQKIIEYLIQNAVEIDTGLAKVYSREGIQRFGYSFSDLLTAMMNKEVVYFVDKTNSPPLSFKQFIKFRIL